MKKPNDQHKMKVKFKKIVPKYLSKLSFSSKEQIIWKRYMAGWREVCDECSTTLFNYHYMCKICGYMVCIECSTEFSQMNTDKRKSKDFYLIKKPITNIIFRIKTNVSS
jgi:hypothetical protein